jgi:hypothetical protein
MLDRGNNRLVTSQINATHSPCNQPHPQHGRLRATTMYTTPTRALRPSAPLPSALLPWHPRLVRHPYTCRPSCCTCHGLDCSCTSTISSSTTVSPGWNPPFAELIRGPAACLVVNTEYNPGAYGARLETQMIVICGEYLVRRRRHGSGLIHGIAQPVDRCLRVPINHQSTPTTTAAPDRTGFRCP